MDVFVNFINKLRLLDPPLYGGKFTWSNLRDPPSFSRLDRFLISSEVAALWPDFLQQSFPRGLSDHNPVYISVVGDNWGPKSFKWFDNKELVQQLQITCNSLEGKGIETLLRHCKAVTKEWDRSNRSKDLESVQEIEKKCQLIEKKLISGEDIQQNSKIFENATFEAMVPDKERRT
ncbi:hypothetical protein HRI_002244000 [Hibiscus trionum]|uniref:Endonuclease/exonuclease/phosphatase domain-containing protein n=1 Tax=Hibiscus trionum TaxID=183268 RepID=A0A9W7HYI1_HIBTR|nr:hypothetical protein HRI_002244000 [Hibiscus trionum]